LKYPFFYTTVIAPDSPRPTQNQVLTSLLIPKGSDLSDGTTQLLSFATDGGVLEWNVTTSGKLPTTVATNGDTFEGFGDASTVSAVTADAGIAWTSAGDLLDGLDQQLATSNDSPVVTSNGVLYVSSPLANRVSAIRTSDGSPLWQIDVDQPGSLALSPNGTLYLNAAGNLDAISPSLFQMPGPVGGSLALGNHVLYVASDGTGLTAIGP
jgi:outer membrane protein assembly factor BamB